MLRKSTTVTVCVDRKQLMTVSALWRFCVINKVRMGQTCVTSTTLCTRAAHASHCKNVKVSKLHAAFVTDILQPTHMTIFRVQLVQSSLILPCQYETIQLFSSPLLDYQNKTTNTPLHRELSIQPKMNAGDLQHSMYNNSTNNTVGKSYICNKL